MAEATPAHDFALWALGALTAAVGALAARTFNLGSRLAAAEARLESIPRLEAKIDRLCDICGELKVQMARALNSAPTEGKAE